MSYSGRCACGAVTATVTGEPLAVRQCWCRQCQQVAAGGPTNNALFKTDDIRMTGTVATHGYLAASGNTLDHGYCPACGTPIFSRSSARPHLRVLRLGFLDAGHGLSPTVAIWTAEAPAWATIDPGLDRFEGQPPPPASVPG